MNKVIIINLNGNAYQLEEGGFEALRAYLDTAARRLEGNPDRDEIIGDIEQAIADKFRTLMGANKTVVATREVEGVIAEMGPVEDASAPSGTPRADGPAAAPGAQDGPKAGPAGASPKRLYKISDGAMVAGVCNGLAAYFNIDVTIFRVLFAISAFTYGAGVLLYILLMIILPEASTSAEKAAARGAPFTAQEFIRRAREGYYEGMRRFGDRHARREWKRRFKQEMRGWRQNFHREMHQNAQQWAQDCRQHWALHPYPVFGWWIAIPVLRLLSLLVALLCVFSLISLLATGSVFGILLPAGLPVWAGLIILIVVFQIIALPLKVMRHALYYGGRYEPMYAGWVHFWNTIAWLGFILFLVWFANRHSLQVHDALRNLPHEVHRAVDSFREWWARQ
ncbi:MAG TPA: PspC domain-containing protein [Opitutaceae bacterium]|nr:PspC domain-containing protein [Opitutaceae bacterium]